MTTTWKINQLKRSPESGLVIKVTYSMVFELEQTVGEKTYKGSNRHVGSINLVGDPNDPNFIPFEQLTEQTIIGWVQSELGSTQINEITSKFQTIIQNQLNQKIAPEFLTGLPWE